MKKLLIPTMLLLAAFALSAEDLLQGLRSKDLKSTRNAQIKLVTEKGKPVVEVTGIPTSSDPTRSKYFSFTITLPKEVSLEKKTLKLEVSCKGDPVATGFYVRAYNSGEKKAVWSFNSWSKPFATDPAKINLTAKRDRKMKWEPKMVSGNPANRVKKLEFYIGSKLEKNSQIVRITGLEVIPELSVNQDPLVTSPYGIAWSLPGPVLTKATDLPTATELVKDRQAKAIVLYPDTEAGKKAAAIVTDAIARTAGVKLAARPGTAKDRIPGQTVIMLGNLISNPALQVLYSRYQTVADEFLPGAGGYTIESIVEPFARKKDVIVLGASDDAGLLKAAEVFAGLVKEHGKPGELLLPVTFKTHYTANIKTPQYAKNYIASGIKAAHDRLKNGTHTSLGGQLAQIGLNYVKFRNPLDAKLYVEVARIYAASAQKDARKFGGAWGFDSDFPSYEAIGGWDLIEHDPALTPEDRLAASNMILRWTHEAIFAEARGGTRGNGPVGNHLTHCSLGSLMSALYFGKYYGDELPHPAVWLKSVQKNFSRQIAHAKAFDDCDSYQWLTWRHVVLFSLAMPDETIFRNGVADKVLKVAATTMDNLGCQSPYGDTNGWRSSSSDIIVLQMLYAATGDPLVNYMLTLKKPFNSRSRQPLSFVRHLAAPTVPTSLDGVTIIPMDPGYHKFVRASLPKTPLEKCFDKFSFREKLDPQALYVLVDGVNNGGHCHNDANSVLRYTQFNREWLAENEYVKNQQKYHNSLLVYCDGEAFPLPDYMELADRQDNADAAVVTVRANKMGKSDWTRYYVWLKQEKAWMLIDELAAREAGAFRMIQRWNGVGAATVKPDGYELAQGDAKVRLQTSADIRITVNNNADLGRQWASYPHADPVIRVLDQTLEKDLAAGEKVRLAAVWHGVASGDVPEWAVDRIADGFTVHTGKTLYTLTVKADGKMAVRKSALDRPVPARRNLAKAAAGLQIPAIRTQWHQEVKTILPTRMTEKANRKRIPFKLTGTHSKTPHLFFPSAPNNLYRVIDGSWHEGPDSVMYARDQQVVLNFAFRQVQNLNGVELQTWWGTSGRFPDLPFRVKDMTVLLSDDNFKKDIRKVAFHDASGDQYGGFGSTIPYELRFPEQQARQVRVIINPPKNGAIYLGEVNVLGTPAKELNIAPPRESFTQIIRVQEKSGDYLAAATQSGRLMLLTPEGKEIKSLAIGAPINDIAALDVDQDGKKELILVCKDGLARVIKTDGKPVWSFKFPYYRKFPNATIVRIADLEGDGEPEIIVGCDNWRTYVLNRHGKELWNYEVIRETRAVQPVDLNGDGKLELICGTAYMTAQVLTHKGFKIWGGRFGNGCRATAAPLNGNARNRTVVLGLDNGKINYYDRKGKVTASFLTGDEIFMMTEAPEANGKQDIYVCSYNGFVYRLTADGKKVWTKALPDSVVRIALLPDGGLAAGTISGDVCCLTADGRIRSQAKFAGGITCLTVDGKRLLVTTDKGEIAALQL